MPLRRIFFYASWPDLSIGYAKVAHRIANFLAEQPDVEVTYWGVGRAQGTPNKRHMDPRIQLVDVGSLGGDSFGVDHIAGAMEHLKPDIFLVYNDIIVTCRLFNALLAYRSKHKEQTRFVSYLDLVYPFEKAALVQHVDRNTDQIFVFSPCWKRNLETMGVPADKLFVFPHGVPERPTALSQAEARRRLGLSEDAFILLNANRNTYRKAQDILIAAFVHFLVREAWDPRIFLFIHCEPATSGGFSIMDLVEIEAMRYGVSPADIHKHILRFAYESNKDVSDEIMTTLYVATDVGINTCMGEGFGLCNAEHAALGRPQIVSGVGALPDIFAEGGAILVPPRVWIRVPTLLDEHSGDLGVCDADDFAAAMSLYFHDESRRLGDGRQAQERISHRYNWSTQLEVFKKNLLT